MNKQVMETIDKYTRLHLKALVEKDKHDIISSMAKINAADEYIGGTDMMLFTSAVHIELVRLSLEMSKDFYTRVHKSDIIIESNGGEK